MIIPNSTSSMINGIIKNVKIYIINFNNNVHSSKQNILSLDVISRFLNIVTVRIVYDPYRFFKAMFI